MRIDEGINHILSADSDFKEVFERAGNMQLPLPQEPFESLVESIVSQQLSTKAAATIMGRVRLTLENEIKPLKILSTSPEQLRSAGLSRQKSSYLYALAEAFNDSPEDYQDLFDLSDEVVIERLTQIKGIGVWTAQMFLMFTLLREDVFPIGDLGIRRGMELFLYGGEKQDHHILIQRAEVWAPFRSVASLALWKAQD